jgi:hypothetical protein
MRSFEPGETWDWRYVGQLTLDFFEGANAL